MKYSLFIDDERFPPDDNQNWYITRNLTETKIIVAKYGFPEFISFDHDLGDGEPTGFEIVKWMVEQDMDGIFTIPPDFNYYTHSQNPVGKKNIEGYINNYLKVKYENV